MDAFICRKSKVQARIPLFFPVCIYIYNIYYRILLCSLFQTLYCQFELQNLYYKLYIFTVLQSPHNWTPLYSWSISVSEASIEVLLTILEENRSRSNLSGSQPAGLSVPRMRRKQKRIQDQHNLCFGSVLAITDRILLYGSAAEWSQHT